MGRVLVFFVLFTNLVCLNNSPLHAVERATIAVFEKHEEYLNVSSSYALSWKLLEEASKTEDIQLNPIESAFNASLNRLKEGRIELVFPAFKTKERESWASFTYRLTDENSSIFTTPSNPAQSLADIEFSTAAVGVSASSYQKRLASELGFKNIYEIADRGQLYDMLYGGRIDYAMFAQSNIKYYCMYHAKKDKSDCMKQVGDPVDFNATYAMALKGNKRGEALLSRINEQILQMAMAESSQKLFSDFGYSENDFAAWSEQVKVQASTSDIEH